MPYVCVGQENSGRIDLYYDDLGAGEPVVLVHGFPFSSRSWEKQVPPLLAAGHRVIAYDRRGFGGSSRPGVGYDYDTFADDLTVLVEELDLSAVSLVGFSMGTGEIVRYLGTHGSARVRSAVLLAPIPPFLLRTDDNPRGIDQAVFDAVSAAIVADRPAYLEALLDEASNADVRGRTRISEQARRLSWNVATEASAVATLACVRAWLTDFRDDLPAVDVPTLVVQGTEDRILPIDVTGRRLPELVADVQVVEIDGGPHNICWTHADEVNGALLEFLAHDPPQEKRYDR
ncbi:MAG: alpha/beta hydrolase [Pseudonocardia sp.]|uniref:alpha/beta fold hydrolase n=1 Tax=Pseudonocardia sp. TaxID=60912 RepID=UPI001ACFB4D6|nr:alpha/beta hydrolase [Pseudonocardia sp.]MBN9102870.1 alpha/beta hydrolase [Pseudonocardia sp.]